MGRLDALTGRRFDLVVIGGGIVGTAIARDAALRNLSVALVEQEDLAWGTTARSSRLIHGGLRYLAHLDFRLVRQDLHEREVLLRTAPHLVRPLPFLVPVYRGGRVGRAWLGLGLTLYDMLAFDRSLPGKRWLSREALLREEPSLRPEGLEGGYLFYDAQAPFMERLCVENALACASRGGVVLTRCRARGLLARRGRVYGLEVEDRLTGEQGQVEGRVVINATGPWAEAWVGNVFPMRRRSLLRLSKGVHLLLPHLTRYGLVLFSPRDGRLFFVLPWEGFSLVGTTDTPFSGDPSQAVADAGDVEYLREGASLVVPAVRDAPLYATYAGVRALAYSPARRESDVGRQHRILDHGREGLGGLLTILGGKATAARAIAREVVDRACALLDWNTESSTYRTLFPGAPRGEWQAWLAVQEAFLRQQTHLSPATARHLARLYGERSAEVALLVARNPRLGEPLCPHHPHILAQVHHAVQSEWALTPGDFLLRRTLMGLSPCYGLDALDAVVREMGELLGWDTAQAQRQREGYLREVALLGAGEGTR
ncbi:MAG: glycerol-3-phosphate dehydrogenase/oxidase [Dehalococcoidia bacterium]|nr:glycerol-3-phosphate dehydrogenase/oxidase [Dehalococcoidia bacterium]MDW8119864.1 glycerol-3-phosphate dehydrogenase/oxidase [Chloroflexota bacterium]